MPGVYPRANPSSAHCQVTIKLCARRDNGACQCHHDHHVGAQSSGSRAAPRGQGEITGKFKLSAA
eukprot:2310245-Rhodomonas_salina.2